MIDTTLSRRQFITTALTATGGFALGVGIARPAEAASLSVRPWGDDAKRYPGEINAWVVIEPDDTVIIRYGRAEMGQGSFTALPQILTEELECDWAFVKPEYASANRNLKENKVYGSLATGGSRAVRETGELVQQAGASARERLIAAAAKRWNVPASECSAAMSKVTHKPTGRTFRFGELAADAAAIKLEKEPALKRPDQYKFIGRRLARLDVPLKINGSAKYGIDLDVPGMVRAAIIKCPVFGGTVKSVDESAIAGRRGVLQVVKLRDAVAVVADRYFRAQAALNVLPIEFQSLIERITGSQQYEACLLGFNNVELDPNSQMNIWMSSGTPHALNPKQIKPTTPWEDEIDRLMEKQHSSVESASRKQAFDRVQQVVVEQQPIVYLVHPDVLVAASPSIRGLEPTPLPPHLYWNIERVSLATLPPRSNE